MKLCKTPIPGWSGHTINTTSFAIHLLNTNIASELLEAISVGQQSCLSNLCSANVWTFLCECCFPRRGDHIVPNFEEIWPSGRSKKKDVVDSNPNKPKGMNYVLSAMSEGLPGNRDGVFTTVGKPKVCCWRLISVLCSVMRISKTFLSILFWDEHIFFIKKKY